MGVPTHDLATLEQQRRALEHNVLELQKSLYHWRTLEADYDGIRDEVKELDENATTDDFLLVSREFGSEQVKEEDMKSILDTQGKTRSREQVVDMLGRRIDYVQQNVSVMEKRLRAAEDELYALDAADIPPVPNGSDFAMKEILEELDDDGEIVSSSVNMPGDEAPQLLELLKKAGVQDIPDMPKAEEEKSANNETESSEAEKSAEEPQPAKEDIANGTESSSGPASSEPAHEAADEESADEELDLSRPVSLVTDADRSVPPVTNVDESAEDARLRREMLQYGIDEVGAIVAELELDEEGSEFSVDDEEFDFGSEDEDEDEFGRSRTELSDDYHQQMRELQSKLTGRDMLNMGKELETFPEDVEIQEVEQVEDVQQDDDFKKADKGNKPKKRVAFADELDIAPAPGPSVEQIPTTEKRTLPPMPEAPPLADAIVERQDHTAAAKPATAEAPKKVSRFKSARLTAQPPAQPSASTASTAESSEPQTTRKQANAVPSVVLPPLFSATPEAPKPFSTPIADKVDASPQPPQGKTLADTLVERDIAQRPANAPELDELDEDIHRKEIASEFYRLRNRRIQNNGGFVNDEEPEHIPLNVEEQPKRVSKFKAARMK